MNREQWQAKILKDARQLLARPNGWARGAWRKPRVINGRYDGDAFCAIGALEEAMASYHTQIRKDAVQRGDDATSELTMVMLGAKRLVMDCINHRTIPSIPLQGPSIPRWNDAPGGTQEEVVEKFDCAINKALEKVRLSDVSVD